MLQALIKKEKCMKIYIVAQSSINFKKSIKSLTTTLIKVNVKIINKLN